MAYTDPTKEFSRQLMDGATDVQLALLERLAKAEVDLLPSFYCEILIISRLHTEGIIREQAIRILELGQQEIDSSDAAGLDLILPYLDESECEPTKVAPQFQVSIHQKLAQSERYSNSLIEWSIDHLHIPECADFILETGELILQYHPQNTEAYYILGMLYKQQLKNPVEAQKYFKSALKIDKDHRQAKESLVEILIELEYLDYSESQKYLEELLEAHPHEGKYYQDLARLCMEQLKDYERAEQLIDVAISLEPENCGMLVDKARLIWLTSNDPNQAAEYLEEQLDQVKPQLASPLFRALAQINIRHFKHFVKARSYYLEAIEFQPGDYEMLTEVNTLLINQFSDFGTAKSLFEFFFEHNSSSAKAHADYALFLQNYTHEKALMSLHARKALSLDPSLVHLESLL